MAGSTYYLTQTAIAHYTKIIKDTAKQWGKLQAQKCHIKFEAGFQDIVEYNKTFPSLTEITGTTSFSIHHVEHLYCIPDL